MIGSFSLGQIVIDNIYGVGKEGAYFRIGQGGVFLL